jgi:PAS domain S-box-containing protein
VIEGPPEAWELRGSRELLDTIITCAPVGFGLLDPAMLFVRVNEELAGIGGRDAEQLVGRRPHDVMPPPWGEALAGPFRRVLESGDPVDHLEIRAPTAAAPGRDHTWLASGYPVRHDGEIVAVGIFVTDISDRVRAERELQLLFEVGEALDATLGVEERLARLAELVIPVWPSSSAAAPGSRSTTPASTTTSASSPPPSSAACCRPRCPASRASMSPRATGRWTWATAWRWGATSTTSSPPGGRGWPRSATSAARGSTRRP